MDDQNNAKIIDLHAKRKAQNLRRKIGRSNGKNSKKPASAGRAKWLAYIQFFLVLFLVAWLMRQC
jgi:hypothetical protein